MNAIYKTYNPDDEMIKFDWVYEPVLPGDKDYPSGIPATTSVLRNTKTGLIIFD